MERIQKIEAAIKQFSCTAKEWKGIILILDKKGQNIGHVKPDNTVVRKQMGSRQLMGALIRDAIKAVL